MRAWSFLLLAAAAAALAGCDGEAETCNELSFPAPPSDAEAPIFVAAECPLEGANGTREHPFNKLNAALAVAPEGATILVAVDTSYEEDLIIDKSLRLIAASTDTSPESTTVVLRPTVGPGVVVRSGAKDVLIRGLMIERAKGVGLWAAEGSTATFDGVHVHQTEADGDGNYGYGILANSGAKATITRALVTNTPTAGIYITGAEASIEDTAVYDTAGRGAIRLEEANGTVAVRDTILNTFNEVGILVSNSKATIERATIMHGIAASAGIGDGIAVRRRKDEAGAYTHEADATIDSCVITQIPRVGVLFSEGATGTLSLTTISSIAGSQKRGAAVWVQSGAGGEDGVLITKNTIRLSTFLAVGLTSGARAQIKDNAQINETQLGVVYGDGFETVELGDGVGVFGGAHAVIEGNDISANQRFGVIMEEPAEDTIIQGNKIRNSGQFGLVIQKPTSGIPLFGDNIFELNGFGESVVLGPEEVPFYVMTSDLQAP